ncbi:hypothetical protein [Acetilactobacillus jinshanensis]|uniref:Uncharacterized protein n=1 Tax=Acetilactobacillus jinshanensis TaxID=1720083 RepID=A0A4V1ALS0_9LACO|nr:hypothetical protein [Acetilactobacillus jinshanensis]QBP18569.1 hypothetical protein ELX58_05370 [Acetilactobacillus jinshanensis]
MSELHHKLKIFNDYLHKDFQLAAKNANGNKDIVQLAVRTLSVSLSDRKKAKCLYPLMRKVSHFYLNSKHGYNLYVAVLVSRHRCLNKEDYIDLRNVLEDQDLPRDVNIAKSSDPISEPSLLSRIF